MSDDSDLRGLFHDAVSDVHPHDDLEQIRSRTPQVAPMNRRWLLPVLAAAAATIVVIGGVMALTGGDPRDDQPPAAQQPTASGSPKAATVSAAVPVYFVGTTAVGPRLYREFQRQEVCPGVECLMTASVRAAVSGSPQDGDYRVPWPAGTSVKQVTYTGDVLTIDLTGDVRDRPNGMSEQEAASAVQQVIYSAQAALGQGRPPVQLLVDGQHSDQVLGEPSTATLEAGSADSVLASVSIDSPAEGSTVGTRFEVTGQAATFEANVVWELKRGDATVRHGFTTARECCTLSPYSFTVTAPPGSYTLVVHDTNEATGEGVGTSQDTKDVTVR